MNGKNIDINKWNRKEHFHFFKTFNQPFFGFNTNIDCTEAYHYCKENQISFYLYYLHAALKAINAIENFKMRIVEENVVLFDKINVSPTVGRDDGTFGFSFMEYSESFNVFEQEARAEIDRVKAMTGLCLTDTTERIDTIHFSAVPWIDFTSVQHASFIGGSDSCPKVSVGKMTEAQGTYRLPVSLHAHHALCDGLHAGLFFEKIEQLLSSKNL